MIFYTVDVKFCFFYADEAGMDSILDAVYGILKVITCFAIFDILRVLRQNLSRLENMRQ